VNNPGEGCFQLFGRALSRYRDSLVPDTRLHRALAVEAAQVGVSLNALVASKLAKATNI
jgi:hypothetical protein